MKKSVVTKQKHSYRDMTEVDQSRWDYGKKKKEKKLKDDDERNPKETHLSLVSLQVR